MKTGVTLFTVAALLTGAFPALAQDPVKISPKLYTVLLENEHVRVLEFRAKPGDKEPMHFHPAGVVYVLSAGSARFTTPDGRSEVRHGGTATVLWSDAVTHSYEYIGPGDAHVLIIEMKGVPAGQRPTDEGVKQ